MQPMKNKKEVAAHEKWGVALEAGFQQIPDVLFKYQHSIGLSCVDVVVLLNFNLHWWSKERKPFTRVETIARRMGTTPRTVQRSIKKLISLGLAKRAKESDRNGNLHTVIDLDPLVERLEYLAKKNALYKQEAKKSATAPSLPARGGPRHVAEVPF